MYSIVICSSLLLSFPSPFRAWSGNDLRLFYKKRSTLPSSASWASLRHLNLLFNLGFWCKAFAPTSPRFGTPSVRDPTNNREISHEVWRVAYTNLLSGTGCSPFCEAFLCKRQSQECCRETKSMSWRIESQYSSFLETLTFLSCSSILRNFVPKKCAYLMKAAERSTISAREIWSELSMILIFSETTAHPNPKLQQRVSWWALELGSTSILASSRLCSSTRHISCFTNIYHYWSQLLPQHLGQILLWDLPGPHCIEFCRGRRPSRTYICFCSHPLYGINFHK